METDKWNDVFQELRDFSPSPPESVKAAIDQQLASATTQTFGRSKKWIIYLSSFLLLVSTGLVIYFFSQSTTSNSSTKDVAVNSTSDTNSESSLSSHSNQEINALNSNDSELYVNKHLKNSLQQKESISTLAIKNEIKQSTEKVQKTQSKNKLSSKTSNENLIIKNQGSVNQKNTKFNQSTNKSTKNSASKSSNKKSNHKSKGVKSTQNTNVQHGSTVKLKNEKESTSSSKTVAELTDKNSDLEKESIKDDELKTENKLTEDVAKINSDKTFIKTENKLEKSDSTEQVEKAKSVDETSITESVENLAEKKDLADKNGGKPNLKNEFGVYGGPMFTSNKRTTNLPSVQLQSKTGIQVNAYYGFRLNDRLKVNAGFSYQNYKEKLSQNSPAYTDSVVTSYTVIYIPNPVDTTLIDTIVTPIYTVQQNPAVNAANEIQLNRFGLNTGLSFLVYENPKMNWSYNVRFGHQLYYSQRRSIQNDLSAYPSTIGKWSGAFYFDNYLSKNIGLLNVTFGVSSTYDYTNLTNWSGIEKKRLYFSPYIGFSMQF